MLLGIVCGFRAEARIAARLTPLVAIGWGDPMKAADDLIARGATALLSFGLAGGLDPAIPTGTLLMPRELIAANGERLRADERLWNWLLMVLPPSPLAGEVSIAGSDSIIATVEAKAALFARTGAAATDMESEAVARAAHRAGLPFAILRAIADSAADALPPAALAALDDKGDVRPLAVMQSLARRPAQIPALIRTGAQSRVAMRALKETVEHLEI